MTTRTSTILLIVISVTANLFILAKSSNSHNKRVEYTNEFAVHIDAPVDQVDSIAQENGFINRGQVSKLRGHTCHPSYTTLECLWKRYN